MGMKNPLSVLQDIKALVAKFNEAPEAPAAPAAPQQLAAEYSLVDGTKVLISELVAGGTVTLETGDPAPAGSHTLADGTVIEVGEAGVIASVTPPQVEEVEAPEAEDMGKQYYQKIEAIEAELASLKTAHESLKEAFGKQSEINNALLEMMETLVKEPVAEPTVKPNGFKRHSIPDKREQVAFRINDILNNKK